MPEEDREIAALSVIVRRLEQLDQEALERVLNYLNERYR